MSEVGEDDIYPTPPSSLPLVEDPEPMKDDLKLQFLQSNTTFLHSILAVKSGAKLAMCMGQSPELSQTMFDTVKHSIRTIKNSLCVK